MNNQIQQKIFHIMYTYVVRGTHGICCIVLLFCFVLFSVKNAHGEILAILSGKKDFGML